MKKFLMFLCAVTLVFGMVGSASAVPFVYTDTYINETYIEGGESISWEHNINDSGFDSSKDNISSVDILLGLRDDTNPLGDPYDLISIDLVTVTGDFETATLSTDGIIYDLGEIDMGLYTVNLTAWLQLQDTGLLNVTLTSLEGDFYFTFSQLTATGDTAPVPEPSTILLLGTGLLGLVGYGRKRFSKKS